ncbi:MAG: ATP-dependent RNA helicase HrpA, partial [Acidimicrobiia bacterium]|nr:ATP-dependent RNA helicase HrpA [Acidimicrobiia bacterium]
PRRIAARSIAERVAEELGSSVGELVGYTVRFSDQTGDDTLIKVMTDGILLAEIQRDRRMMAYDTIILDEAHERSLNIDFLLGYLKGLLPRRPDLKLIITSATIDTERFSEHFGGAPIVEVSGRTYPVELRYRPLDDPGEAEVRDQPQGICDAVEELTAEGQGDVLVFCSGEREIRDATDALQDLGLRHTEIVPLYGRLSAAEQHRVFQPHTGRRVVVSTNVAETSLTVPGIRYVVDAGTARMSRFSRRTKVQQLPIEPVSRASADQRAGRCGRLGPGICIRLYSRDDFDSRPEFTEPEILRTQLASVILQMAAIGLGDIEEFPFLDPPDRRAIQDGIALLEELGAVDPELAVSGKWLTKLGRQLAGLPLDLRLARMVVEAEKNVCLSEILVIASALAIQDPRERPTGSEAKADQAHARFRDEASDFLSWLHLWDYLRTERRARSSSQFRKLCREEFLNYRRVREWQDVHTQLREACNELGFRRNRQKAPVQAIHRSILSGLLSHIGMKDPDSFEYRGARGARFSINPGSTLFKRALQWVMAGELVETTRLWARAVAPVDPTDVEELGAHLVKRSYSDPWWDADRGAAVANETVTIYGLPLHTDRVVQFGTIDPVASRDLFIRHALVAGDWETHHRFAGHNRQILAEALALEDRFRRNDVLVDDDTVVAFFAARLPSDITTVRHFDRWWRDHVGQTPHLLDLTVEDLIESDVELPDEAFPEEWHHGDVVMPIDYEYDPASPTDGITVDVPLSALDRVDPAVFEWNVPGLREELLVTLVRSLPKQVRKALAPISETVDRMLDGGVPGGLGVIGFLRREVTARTGFQLAPNAVDLNALPAHLRPYFRIVAADGSLVAEGHDLASLREQLRETARTAVNERRHPIERSGLTEWSFGELPEVIGIRGSGRSVDAYPALVDDGDAVSIRLVATPEEQAETMWAGVRRLVTLQLPAPGKLVRQLLTNEAKLDLVASPYPDQAAWAEDCMTCALDEILVSEGGPPWDAVGFDALVATTRDDLYDRLADVARASLEILSVYREIRHDLDRPHPEAMGVSVDDMRRQLDTLVYAGFVSGVGSGRLSDVHRYLRGIKRRFEQLADDPARDLARLGVVQTYEAEHDRLGEFYSGSLAHIDVAWMLQELRISLFAQALGTRGKVSEARVGKALAKLELS